MPEQLGNYIILEQIPPSQVSKAGVILLKPQTGDRTGKVISAPKESAIKPGDFVLYPHRGGSFLDEDCKLIGISEDNIYAILETNPLSVNLGI